MSRTKQSDAPFRRSGGKHGSGMTHIRYGHNRRPTLIHVRCPRCGSRASATKPSESGMGLVTDDLCGTWHLSDWVVTCSTCPFRLVDGAYEALPPLYFEDEGIFAWNRDHLQFISLHLSGCDTTSDPYHCFATYIRGEWLRHRAQSIKTVARLLSRDTIPRQA